MLHLSIKLISSTFQVNVGAIQREKASHIIFCFRFWKNGENKDLVRVEKTWRVLVMRCSSLGLPQLPQPSCSITRWVTCQRWIFLFSWRCAPPTDFFIFVQKYSIWGVSCRNIHIMVYCAEILVRCRYMLHENEANQWITCRFSEFLIELCKKKHFFGGFVQNYHFFGGLCRNITVPSYCTSGVLCRAFFRGCAEILIFGEIFSSAPLSAAE